MHILIFSDSYPPELRSAAQLMKDLAEGLHARGHRVTVVTSLPAYNLAGDDSAPVIDADRTENGVRVLRTWVLPHHRVNFFVRGIAQLALPFFFFRSVKKNVHEPIDAVILHTPPLPLARAAERIQRKYGAKFFLNVHDIFPQNAVDLGVLNQKLLVWFFERMERRAYRSADLLVVPSESHKEYLHAKRDIALSNISVIPHWIDYEPFARATNSGKFRARYGLENNFLILFAGVLGPSQGLDLILRLAERVRENKDITFLFVGNGSEKARLQKEATERGLVNVKFEPFVSAEEYPNLLKEADVGVITLSEKNTTPAVPAKLIGYMAAGLPVAAFLHKESDGHAIVRDARCGETAPYGDEKAAAEALLRLYADRPRLAEYGRNAVAYTKKHFLKEICVAEWDRLLRA